LHCQIWLDAQHRREIFHTSSWGCCYGAAYCASAQLRITNKAVGSNEIFAGALILIVFAAAIRGFLDGKKCA